MTHIKRSQVAAEQNRLRRRRRKAIASASRHAKTLADQLAAEFQLTEGLEMYECSYCTKPAVYVGDGQDGDIYCEAHKARADGSVTKIAS